MINLFKIMSIEVNYITISIDINIKLVSIDINLKLMPLDTIGFALQIKKITYGMISFWLVVAKKAMIGV
jgi:hypothetical protein